MKTALFLLLLGCVVLRGATPQEQTADSINQFALDFYRAESSNASGNVLFSPYSIELALAMTYAGADGETRAEMQRVLHYDPNDEATHGGFSALNEEVKADVQASLAAHASKPPKKHKRKSQSAKPIELEIANNLFVQRDWTMKEPFVSLVEKNYGTAPKSYDFKKDSAKARIAINHWAEENSNKRITDLIPAGALNSQSRLVLANALYFRARWEEPFDSDRTDLRDFLINGIERTSVPTMATTAKFGYQKGKDFTLLTFPYIGATFQLVIILPDGHTSLTKIEKLLTASDLTIWKDTPARDVEVFLPKLTLEPETLALKSVLMKLGLRSAFDEPKGSANLSRIVDRKPNDYLAVSEVFHKTWLALDEEETEAAASTDTVTLVPLGVVEREVKPPVVHVDHPFLLAIQHVKSGAYLFFGRVTNPR